MINMAFRAVSDHVNISFGTVVALTLLTKDPAGSLFLLSFSTDGLFAVELIIKRDYYYGFICKYKRQLN